MEFAEIPAFIANIFKFSHFWTESPINKLLAKKRMNPYHLAQHALADLKTSILLLLESNPDGLKNVEIGKSLGIYSGHVGHEGHIPRTMLAIMEAEGLVNQDENKVWCLKKQKANES